MTVSAPFQWARPVSGERLQRSKDKRRAFAADHRRNDEKQSGIAHAVAKPPGQKQKKGSPGEVQRRPGALQNEPRHIDETQERFHRPLLGSNARTFQNRALGR
jgi:hypothetical protein